MAKIFVGGLPKSCTDADISSHFSQYGTVSHVQLHKDLVTGESKGYCFVTYENTTGAEKALSSYDQHCISGKWVEVKKYEAKEQQHAAAHQAALNGVATALQAVQQPAKSAYLNSANLNMMNSVPYGMNLNNLNAMVAQDLMAINLIGNQHQQYINKDANGKNQKEVPSGPIDEHKVFVGGLPKTITEADLHEHFSQFGKIKEIDIKKERETGTGRGFCFVIFEAATSSKSVLESYEKHEIKGKWVECKAAVITNQNVKGNAKGACKGGMHDPNSNFEMNKVFLGGIPSSATEESVRQFFSRYGNILEVQLKKDENGKPRGFGFVIYDSIDAACAAIAGYNQNMINDKWVEVKHAEKVFSLKAKSVAAQAALAVVGGGVAPGVGKGMGKGGGFSPYNHHHHAVNAHHGLNHMNHVNHRFQMNAMQNMNNRNWDGNHRPVPMW